MQSRAAGDAPRAAIYCRLSEEDADKADPGQDSRSIQNQKSMLVRYAVEQGWQIYNIYSDDDYTGSDRERPQFNRLLEDARRGCFDIVLCKSQSRFTREMELVEKYIHGLFVEWSVRFVGYADNADTANRGNKKARQINGLVKNISHSGKVSNDFSLFRRFCCINRCFRCSCGKFAIVHGVQAAIGFRAATIGEKRDLPETHPVQQRTESRHPCCSTRAKPASKGLGRALSV